MDKLFSITKADVDSDQATQCFVGTVSTKFGIYLNLSHKQFLTKYSNLIR